jgi:myo-inositol 2-dehydrogenase / D-chiro-inositol 1-dehydrogenase
MNVALFGAGRIGKIHASNVAGRPGVSLKYVVDISPEAAAGLGKQHGAQATVSETVFNDSSVEAVVIASSTDTHADLIMRSSTAGKAIFCEKPVDLSLERARLCAEAVSRAGVTCMIGFNRRFNPTFAAVKKRLDAGEIGEPEMMIITSRDPGAPPVSYIKVSGGIFKDMLIHDFDMFRFVLGDEAETVYATGSCLVDPAIADAGDIDSSVVTIRTRRGRLCQINTSRRAVYGYDQRFEVLGSKGMLQAGNVRPTQVAAYTSNSVSTDLPEAFFLERYRAAYAIEMAHFFDALTEGKPVPTSIEDGVKALELADAATRSWAERKIITLKD